MARIIVCKGCGKERRHHAKALCQACYNRYIKRPIIICIDCGEEKEHCAHGLCRSCYMRRYEQGEGRKAYLHHYNYEHREGQRAYQQQYRENNREKRASTCRRWKQANPEKQAAQAARRRARKARVADTLTQNQIDFETRIAKSMWPSEDLHLHHIVPISKGGNHSWGNIMIIPALLNCSIGDKLPEEIYKQETLEI